MFGMWLFYISDALNTHVMAVYAHCSESSVPSDDFHFVRRFLHDETTFYLGNSTRWVQLPMLPLSSIMGISSLDLYGLTTFIVIHFLQDSIMGKKRETLLEVLTEIFYLRLRRFSIPSVLTRRI